MYRVAEVNRHLVSTLEEGYPDFWLEGELSDVKRGAKGHIYFAVNDERERAQLRAVMFARDATRARAQMRNGERVRLRGGLSLFPPSGQLQFIARIALPSGEGDLAAMWEKIKTKLAADGLLAVERKRPLPVSPRVVGVVTSLNGAALQDIIRVAHARAPVRLVVADCRVQGPEAPRSIVRALTMIQKLEGLDVVILGRGGGSAEDLWAFNDERVARAVARCRVPVVCGVGHETDIAIAELVADARASTPSNAAELAVPELGTLLKELESRIERLQSAARSRLRGERLTLERLTGRLGDPRRHLVDARRQLEHEQVRLRQALAGEVQRKRAAVDSLQKRLEAQDPRRSLRADRERLADLEQRLQSTIMAFLADERQRLAGLEATVGAAGRPMVRDARSRLGSLSGRLNALSPLKVLERGYAIAFDGEGKAIVRSQDTEVDAKLDIKLSQGSLRVRVEKLES